MSFNDIAPNDRYTFVNRYFTNALSIMKEQYSKSLHTAVNDVSVSSLGTTKHSASDALQTFKDINIYSSCTGVTPVEKVESKNPSQCHFRIICERNPLWDNKYLTRDNRGSCVIRTDLQVADLNSAHLIEEDIQSFFSTTGRNRINAMKKEIYKSIHEIVDKTINDLFNECRNKYEHNIFSGVWMRNELIK